MKKIFVIVIAAMCVMSCGQRRAAKSQESQKEPCQKEEMEVVEHQCCGHHGAEGCPAEVTGKECEHADAEGECQHASKELEEACRKVDQTVKEAAANMEKECEKAKSDGAKVIPMGKKADPKPIKPVPKPKK